jgi:hypothetical protein
MATFQFIDLPLIPHSMDDISYPSWGVEHSHYAPSYKHQDVSYRSDEAVYFGDFDNGVVSMQPTMKRFMLDSYPLAHGVLHAKIPVERQFDNQYDQQWLSVDCYRNISPDRTSASGNSSYASQQGLCSPLVHHADPYGSPTGIYLRSPLPYPTTEHFNDGGCPPNTPLSGGLISLRELEYEHPAPEPIVKDIEGVELKQETVCEHEHIVLKTDTVPESYPEYADSGIGNSVRDAESVQPMDIPEDPASDSDYSPSRPGKRRRSSASQGSPNKASKRRGSLRNDTQTASPPRSPKTVKRPRKASSTTKPPAEANDDRRSFPCPLSAYSCTSTFSSKNEWKRHVSTQHIKLSYWRCDLCPPTTDPKDDQVLYYNDFNRKDLFTQHLRRMHAAPKGAPSSAKDFPVNEDNLAVHQARCLQALRSPPQHSACLFCDKTFEGVGSWEERLEHVGRHFEKDRKSEGGLLDVAGWNGDEGLERYLLDEGLVVRDAGGWKIGDGKARRAGVGDGEESEEE